MTVVLGVDAGGTSSRAVAVTTAGAVAGRGRAGGGNPMALGAPRAFANLALAVREALTSVDPAEVTAVTVGLAGLGMLHDPAVHTAFEEALRGCGLAVAPRAVGDAAAAFAAGTAMPSGTVLISGTGAIAAKIIDRRPVALADGYGWLLGDEGSAFWLGRAAARLAVRQSAGEPGPLSRAVVRHLLAPATGTAGAADRETPGTADRETAVPVVPGRETADLLATAVQARPPIALAELAPLVSEAAAAGDPDAEAIVAEAAARLAATVSRVREPGDRTPIVLAGSVLTSEGPVRRAVQDLLRRRWEEAPVTVAGDGAGAAAWLAVRLLLDPREAAGLHHRFVHPA
ncbi:N-acetylglucosamine kinase [Planobispora rosea]|uniref:N-acetylglucosamine kinase n=1 Tax=Planobispora rosea TaxID=35762 RepID=A0A8J3W9P1_PLARO|nr:BadF/BadG/BcrA/BcrD ATPase family protein [Planobispora rosea]GGS67950.1 N-acetylglucosamine kinase [Planobispora rosea]GIH81934.1 N-acetylglucosamine kinase [Planobispora rosea]